MGSAEQLSWGQKRRASLWLHTPTHALSARVHMLQSLLKAEKGASGLTCSRKAWLMTSLATYYQCTPSKSEVLVRCDDAHTLKHSAQVTCSPC